MKYRASRNHWDIEKGDHVPQELRRLMELRYGAAAATVDGVVFDAGCGHGYGSFILAEAPRVTKVLAVDADGVAVAIARTKLNGALKVHLSISNIEQCPVPPCDWAVCTEVIEHLDKPEKFLAKLKATVTAGIVISWPLRGTVNPYHSRIFQQGDMARLMDGWAGNIQHIHQRDPEGKSLREHDLGVYTKP